jgi:hypothetical protein
MGDYRPDCRPVKRPGKSCPVALEPLPPQRFGAVHSRSAWTGRPSGDPLDKQNAAVQLSALEDILSSGLDKRRTIWLLRTGQPPAFGGGLGRPTRPCASTCESRELRRHRPHQWRSKDGIGHMKPNVKRSFGLAAGLSACLVIAACGSSGSSSSTSSPAGTTSGASPASAAATASGSSALSALYA